MTRIKKSLEDLYQGIFDARVEKYRKRFGYAPECDSHKDEVCAGIQELLDKKLIVEIVGRRLARRIAYKAFGERGMSAALAMDYLAQAEPELTWVQRLILGDKFGRR
jgi:hypothetical protein